MKLSEKDKKFLTENDQFVYLYRVQYYTYIPSNEYDFPFQSTFRKVEIHPFKYEIISYTEKGVWIHTGFGQKRFVLLSARKKFAHETLKKAYSSFIKRKERELIIYTKRCKEINIAISMASSELKKLQETNIEE